MNQKEAYDAGRNAGYNAAIYQDPAESLETAAMEGTYLGTPDKDDLLGAIEYLAFDGEQNARQYAEFSYVAGDINNSGDRAEGLWEKYDEGVSVGITKGARQLIKDLGRDEMEELLADAPAP
jgi:hypothetical protein